MGRSLINDEFLAAIPTDPNKHNVSAADRKKRTFYYFNVVYDQLR